MNPEEQVIDNTPIMNTELGPIEPSTSLGEVELEEEFIPQEDNRVDDDELDDVIPCEYVAIEGQSGGMAYDMTGTSHKGLYDAPATIIPNVSTEKMVDIAPHTVSSSTFELEEAIIPQEDNRPDDDQLDDIVV